MTMDSGDVLKGGAPISRGSLRIANRRTMMLVVTPK